MLSRSPDRAQYSLGLLLQVPEVGRRLEWYLPALPDTDPKTTAFTSDCVSWTAVRGAVVLSS